jgi:PrtD family type I secretion system ABC transporter
MAKAVELKDLPTELRAGIVAARPLLARAAFFSVAVNLLMLTGPIYMLQLYDRVIASRSSATLFVLTVLAIGLYIASTVIDYARSAIIARAAARFDAAIADKGFDAAIDLTRLSAGAAGDAPFRDMRAIRQVMSSGAVIAFFDAPFAPFFLFVVFMLHWSLGLLATVGAAALVGLAIVNERASRKAIAEQMQSQQASDALSGAVMRNAAAADALGMRGALRTRWRTLGAAAGETASGDQMMAISAASKTGRMLLQSLILGLGALLAIKGAVTGGVMVAASIIAARALAPIELAIGQWRQIGGAIQSLRRLAKMFALAPASAERTALPAPKGRLSLERVFAQPQGARKPVLKGISCDIEPGEALGVIGPSGAGKSTLARVMVGVEPIVSGAVRLDGADLFQQQRDIVGRSIGYLPQETELFAGTIRQNIARFAPDASDEDVVAAAKDAGAYEMILAQPDGFETMIAERGAALSVGQRQRVGLARALFGRPVLIVLDEPNAALDAEGEAALSAAILACKARGAAVIIIAHRPSAIAHVDKLLMLVDGEARAYGPRDEVLQKLAGGRVAPMTPIRRAPEGGENAGPSRSNG